MPASDHVAEVLAQHVDLGRCQLIMGVVDEAGVQAQLPQQGQRAQDREPVRVQVADQPEYLLPLPLQVSLIHPTVRVVQFHLEHLFLLSRKIGGHLFLGTARDQRPYATTELGEQFDVVAAAILDRPSVVVTETFRVRE